MPQSNSPSQAQSPPINPVTQNAPPPLPPPPAPLVVVLDPAHGGTDNGARGAGGLVEKDLTLELARATQSELQRQGLNVILTRDGDDNPSFDDRATLANTPRLAIFVTFHVSSTGPPGSVRAYFEHFSTLDSAPGDSAASFPNPAVTQASGAPPATAQRSAQPFNWRPGRTLVPWTEAQRSYLAPSQRLADLIQAALAQSFHGSPDKAGSFAIRDLRSVAAPAVAVELSSVSSVDQAGIQRMTGPLAASVARAIVQFRPGYERQQHP